VQIDSPKTVERIRMLNDLLRATFQGGKVLLTAGVADLDNETRAKVLTAVRTFNAFTRHNDPHGEHDCAFFMVEGERYAFKLEYYDTSLEFGSEDPSNPEVTTRVLTIMRAEDY
jgi:hypothetical protein